MSTPYRSNARLTPSSRYNPASTPARTLSSSTITRLVSNNTTSFTSPDNLIGQSPKRLIINKTSAESSWVSLRPSLQTPKTDFILDQPKIDHMVSVTDTTYDFIEERYLFYLYYFRTVLNLISLLFLIVILVTTKILQIL